MTGVGDSSSSLRIDQGSQMTLRIPMAQFLLLLTTVVGAAGSVIFAVWLTTRDLGNDVSALTSAVKDNTVAIRALQLWRAEERGRRDGSDG